MPEEKQEQTSSSVKDTEDRQDKKHSVAAFVILIIFILIIGVGVWWYLIIYVQGSSYKSLLKWGKNSTITEETTTETTTDETSDWKTYTDDTYNFSFKYPQEIVVSPSKSNGANYHMILINKSDDINADGIVKADVSKAYLEVRSVSFGTTGSTKTINSPSGQLTATYSTGNTPMGYTYYAYEFQNNGKYFLIRMNNYSNKPILLSTDDFKKIVDTITFE